MLDCLSGDERPRRRVISGVTRRLPRPCWCCCRRSPGCSIPGSIRLPTPIASGASARCRPRRRSWRRTSTASSARPSSACNSKPSIVEQQAWSNYAARYQAWADSAIAPEIVKADLLRRRPGARHEPAPTRVRRCACGTRRRTPSTPPHGRRSCRASKLRFIARRTAASRSRQDRGAATAASAASAAARGSSACSCRRRRPATSRSIVVPVMRITPRPRSVRARSAGRRRTSSSSASRSSGSISRRSATTCCPCSSGAICSTIAAIPITWSPSSSRDDPSHVIFESRTRRGGGGAGTAGREHVPLLGPRMGPIHVHGARRRPRRPEPREQRASPPPPPRRRPTTSSSTSSKHGATMAARRCRRARSAGGEGHWRLVAKHRAGSLEAAVSAARTRNFVLSSGILALLATAIGLIVVSARRADRLARQQLEFVAAVSHELRTPVSVIGAAAGNLADGVVDEPGRVKKYGATIQSEARRLARNGRARAAAGGHRRGPRVGRAHADCRSPIAHRRRGRREPSRDRARRRHRRSGDRAGAAELRRPIRRACSASSATPAALRSAIQNLISNAIKYGGDAPLGARQRAALTHHGDAHHASRIAGSGSPRRIASTSSSRSIAAAKPSRGRFRAAASASISCAASSKRTAAPSRCRASRARAARSRSSCPASTTSSVRRSRPRRAGSQARGLRRSRRRHVPSARVLLVEDEPGLQLALSDRLVVRGLSGRNRRRRRHRPCARDRRAVRPHHPRRDAAGARRLRRRAHRCGSRASRRRS